MHLRLYSKTVDKPPLSRSTPNISLSYISKCVRTAATHSKPLLQLPAPVKEFENQLQTPVNIYHPFTTFHLSHIVFATQAFAFHYYSLSATVKEHLEEHFLAIILQFES